MSHSSTETKTDHKRESSVESESALGAAGGAPKPEAEVNVREINIHHHHHHHHYHHYGDFQQQEQEFRPDFGRNHSRSQEQDSGAGLEGLPSYEEAVSQSNTYLRHGTSSAPFDRRNDRDDRASPSPFNRRNNDTSRTSSVAYNRRDNRTPRTRSNSRDSRERFLVGPRQGNARHSTPQARHGRFRTPLHSQSGSEEPQGEQPPRVESSELLADPYFDCIAPPPYRAAPTVTPAPPAPAVGPEDILADTAHIFDDLGEPEDETSSSSISLPDLETIPSSDTDVDVGEHQISILIRSSRKSLRNAFLTAVLRVLEEFPSRSRGFEHRAWDSLRDSVTEGSDIYGRDLREAWEYAFSVGNYFRHFSRLINRPVFEIILLLHPPATLQRVDAD